MYSHYISGKSFNEEVCRWMETGEATIYFDRQEDNLTDLIEVLQHCFPNDDGLITGCSKFYFANAALDKWICSDVTTKGGVYALAGFFEKQKSSLLIF